MRAAAHDRPRTEMRRRSTVVRPLGYNDLCVVADAVAEVAPDWTVELSAVQPNDSSLVIMPEGADDLIGPTFIVSQERHAFRLDQFHWDELSSLGEYTSLLDATRAMLMCLTNLSALAPVTSIQRH